MSCYKFESFERQKKDRRDSKNNTSEGELQRLMCGQFNIGLEMSMLANS